MTDDTTERRAVALRNAFPHLVVGNRPKPTWEQLLEEDREMWRRMAHAVAESDKAAGLKVLKRDPYEDVLVASVDRQTAMGIGPHSDDTYHQMDVHEFVWRSMWDAAPWLPGEGE